MLLPSRLTSLLFFQHSDGQLIERHSVYTKPCRFQMQRGDEKILLAVWLLHTSTSNATDAFDKARAAALTQPAETVALFELQLPELSSTPAWHQRDWLYWRPVLTPD